VKVEILHSAFDPWLYLSEHQQTATGRAGQFGATAVFVGTMRDFNEDESVKAMLLEHYPGMTENYLEKISREAVQRWDLIDSLIVHRVGQLLPGEPIVLVAVWSAHRKAAFEASRYLMEELKSRAPFWKQEQLEAGARWVRSNTPG
jgi:molybdopterin synthase catalytic subunit